MGSPILIISTLWALIALFASEYVIPLTNRQAFEIKRTQIQRLPPHGFTKENDIWYRVARNRILYISLVDVGHQKMSNLTIFEFEKSNELAKRWDAREAHWKASRWTLIDGYLREFKDGILSSVRPFSEVDLDLSVNPIELSRVEREPAEMNVRELRSYIKRASASGIPTEGYKVDLQTKLGIPFTSLVMSLFGVAFALRTKRTSPLVGAGVSLLVGLGYWIVLAVGISLGHSGKLPPFLAAWGANLLFGAGGLLLLWRARN
jgi:lipopolysaccharide export system permease protein